MRDISISVVLYKTDAQEIQKLLNCIYSSNLSYKVYLIDNSPDDNLKHKLKEYLQDEKTEYIFTGKNIGYGAGHNIAINRVKNKSKYHLVINADVAFEKSLLKELIDFMDANVQFAHLMPKVLYPDGSVQHLCRNKPSVQSIFLKRLMPGFIQKKYKEHLDKYEFKEKNYNDFFYDVPFLSGCFMLFRTSVLTEVNGFNESIFLYFEDADITQRILQKHHNVYYPLNYIYHNYKGTKNNFKLSFFAATGLLKYFRTWGFFG